MIHKILVVEDDAIVRDSLEVMLSEAGYEVRSVSDGPQALPLIQQESFQAIILDINLPTMNGLEVLNRIKSIPNAPPVIILTAYGSVQNAVAAMKAGAMDFLIKPCPAKELKSVLQNVISHSKSMSGDNVLTGSQPGSQDRLIGESAPMKEVMESIKKVAETDSNVFILGETGTGKNLVAWAIHNASKRSKQPFVKIDCAALPGELLESELFGHEPGAFTGATGRFIGKFEQAEGGTVFLDEISNLTLPTQAKLLNIIQDREFTRLKGTARIKVNIRLISATNQELEPLIKMGKFREDLFYRLDVVSVNLPSLKEHKEDIPLLCDYFLKKFNTLNQKNIKELAPEVLNALMNYNFPGNIRELANLIEQLVVMNKTDIIKMSDLPSKITRLPLTSLTMKPFPTPTIIAPSFKEAKKLSEKELIINALKETEGNKKKAAQVLKISRMALYNKIKEYNIQV
ncbi:MAG: sigma-54 dependent transcriptional regulator [Planctomycetota bacterium]